VKNRLLVVLLLVVLVVTGSYYFQQRERSLALAYVEGSGTLEATEITLIAQTSGAVVSLPLREGDSVNKDVTLARLDNPVLGYQKRQAQAQLELAQSAYKAMRSAANDALVRGAQAQLDIAKTQADYRDIKSPISGRVLSLPVSEGDTIPQGAVVAVIADLAHLKLQIYVPEYQLGRVKVGTAVRVRVDSYPNRSFPGKITEIASEPEFTPANVQTQDQRVKLVFAATVELPNAGLKLKPGMPADIKLKVR